MIKNKRQIIKTLHQEQQGFTLLELLLVVGVGSILLLAGLGTYRLITAGNNANEANRLLATIKQQVQNLYQGQTTYGTTDITGVLISAGAFPPGALNAAQDDAVTPWNSDITVTGATANFTITFADLPEDACVSLARLEIANDPDFVEIDIGTANYTTLPTPVQAATACDGGSIDITWTFF